jgi:hypothetical protein
MRRMLGGLTLALTWANAAMAMQPAPDYARAYAMAARCMVFNGYINDNAYSRVAFDAWKRLGQLQGLSDARMTDDMQRAIAHETVQFHQHADYRQQTQVDCRALGWAR